MHCLICLQAKATIHVLDWPPDNPQVESHYCAACYERAYAGGPIARVVEDDVSPPFHFRTRFAIRHLMIAAGLSGLLDALLVLFIRFCVRGTPAEIGEIAGDGSDEARGAGAWRAVIAARDSPG